MFLICRNASGDSPTDKEIKESVKYSSSEMEYGELKIAKNVTKTKQMQHISKCPIYNLNYQFRIKGQE
jgi:hypothetical protein